MDSKALGSNYLSALRVAVGQNHASGQAAPAKAASETEVQGQRGHIRLDSLAQARDMAAAGPPVDMDKVADIATRLREGRYEIQPTAIAEAMIRMDLP